MKAYIKAIDYYLPECVVTNEQLVEEFPEWTVEKIASKVGISSRHIAGHESISDMAVKAAECMFTNNPEVRREDIDMLVVCTQSADYKLPSTACIVQHRLGLPTSCGAFDFDLGCSGYEYGLAIAKGFIVGGVASNVLLITSEAYNKYIHPADKGNRTIFGDGASATLISTEGVAAIGDFVLGTDGSHADDLIIHTGGTLNPEKAQDLRTDEKGNILSSDHLYMNGGAIFDFSMRTVPPMVKETLVKNGLEPSDINLYVFHQANRYMLSLLRKRLKIDPEKFYVNLENIGNTVSSTVPIALADAGKEGLLKGNVLVAGFGVGLSWGATVLYFV